MSDAVVSSSLDQQCNSASHLLKQCIQAVEKVYLSETSHTEFIFIALLARGHVLLEGVPGVAKTTLAQSIAKVCNCPMKRIQFTPDLLPSDIVGGSIYNPEKKDFEVKPGPIFTHFLLADELNRAPAKTQSALLEAMQEAQVTLEGQTLALPQPFFTLATQNPIEQVGVYNLPEAQLDRFALKLTLSYPAEAAEILMLQTYQKQNPEVNSILQPQYIERLQVLVDHIFVHTEIFQYIVKLARATRNDLRVALGVSPRASLILVRLAKARALIKGRSFVTPDDIQILVSYTFSHRIRLSPEADFEQINIQDILQDILQQVLYHGPTLPHASI
jgi:MoxR-like ATPase